MSVTSISGYLGLGLDSQASQTSQTNATEMGKQDFLLLLIEQMKSQDPLNPKDPSEFTAQLAQFSSLEQLMNLNTAMTGLSGMSSVANNAAAANFLGREIEASGSQVSLTNGKASSLRYEMGAPAASVKVTIRDSSGAAVRTLDLGSQTQGSQDLVWDGQLDSGATAPDGVYSVDIQATDSGGQSVSVNTFRRGVVSGINYEQGVTLLEMDGQRIPLSDVLSVRLPESKE
ncbi:MAG: flagellar hook assembly protein FlgD [Candidatus Sumerlaeota bacterium]|nr:flagellar hook assembly protein FlgD [Candidatus Sumerlaeota bacterium]